MGSHVATPGTATAILVVAAHDLLRSLAEPSLLPFLEDWPDRSQPTRSIAPSSVPVVAWIDDAVDHAVAGTRSLVELLAESVDQLCWEQTYTANDFGMRFLERYGWSELIGLRGPIPDNRIACGILMLGPGTTYPVHRHEAEEIYVPLSGTARWWRDGGAWLAYPPGTLIHHSSWLPHALETEKQPLIALYLWRAGDLTQKSLIG